jgi:predicted DCC family thiol-disulfide oxidoreductase YuxK
VIGFKRRSEYRARIQHPSQWRLGLSDQVIESERGNGSIRSRPKTPVDYSGNAPKPHEDCYRTFNGMIPKLVYDDDCHFCTWSATFAVRRSSIQPVRLSRVQERTSRLSDDERERLPEAYEECAQLITEDAVYSCGAATERSLVIAGVLPQPLVDFLRKFEDYERVRESVYHFTSDHRDIISNVIGRDPPVSQHVSQTDVRPEKQTK